jgi:hypothetical protein
MPVSFTSILGLFYFYIRSLLLTGLRHFMTVLDRATKTFSWCVCVCVCVCVCKTINKLTINKENVLSSYPPPPPLTTRLAVYLAKTLSIWCRKFFIYIRNFYFQNLQTTPAHTPTSSFVAFQSSKSGSNTRTHTHTHTDTHTTHTHTLTHTSDLVMSKSSK